MHNRAIAAGTRDRVKAETLEVFAFAADFLQQVRGGDFIEFCSSPLLRNRGDETGERGTVADMRVNAVFTYYFPELFEQKARSYK